MITDYTLKLFNKYGKYKTTLEIPLDFEFGRQKNDVGVASILLPASIYYPSLFSEGDMLEIWKYDSLANTDILQVNALWFLQKIELKSAANTIELIFDDQNTLFKRRYIMWYKVEGLGYPSHLLDYTSNILNRIIYHNYGEGVSDDMGFGAASVPATINALNPDNRKMPILQPEGVSPNKGAIVEFECSKKRVLDALQDCAKTATVENKKLIWFDLVYKPISFNSNDIGILEFRTWIGNRGKKEGLVITPGNVLNDGILTVDFSEQATLVYAIGTEDPQVDDGVENFQIQPYPTSYEKSSRFYEIETIVEENGETVTLDTLAALAKSTIVEKRVKKNIQGTIIQIPGFEFGKDYFYGNELLVDFYGEQFTAVISKFTISVSSDGEKITVPLETIDDLLDI